MNIRIQYSHVAGYCGTIENGITYQMELSEMDRLKKTIGPTIADWYNALPREVRVKVKRVGIKLNAENDFFRDGEYD
ncbi:hypothetical protein [Paraflavitalea sp. CAU 1676]|uniref:hypothetical protein n=1 Tax=Paraflavitalea sp. CAU 1676 TaxID=3032598 RepID=UPI0023DB54EB|nr:hypothetical protein [Paraflavitalea sp. CAU 1676]MDF2188654.1 hypothetical protein [Paraflavitalea sp. CAU 1676]